MKEKMAGPMQRPCLAPAVALILILAAVLAPTGAARAETDKPAGQQVRFLVLDARDRPVAGAVIRLTPRAGSPAGKPGLRTDQEGRAETTWLPGSEDLTKGLQTRDRITGLETAFAYRVQAKGYAPALGSVRRRTREVKMSGQAFAKMERPADLKPIYETVVLRAMSEMLAGELTGAHAAGPVARRCLAFHKANAEVALGLGAPFAWPAFRLSKGALAVRFDWRPSGTPADLGQAELADRMAQGSGLPLAILCGQELVPLGGVRTLTLEMVAELIPPDDPHALPQRKVLTISAPAADYQALAAGGLDPDAFLARHRPRLINLD